MASEEYKLDYTIQEINDALGNALTKTHLSDYDDDSTHRLVTDNEKATWNEKQTALESGANIKTVNGESILGSGDIIIQSGSVIIRQW